MACGILIIDKPEGWTSNDVVVRLKRALNERRLGHAGTLDPMATGVLPVFAGRATRAVEFASDAGKEYVAGLRLGLTTDTQDCTGTVRTETVCSITREQVEAVLERFRGEQLQLPPMYSALKVNGKRLYDLARKGREVERQPRPITIYELELLEQTGRNRFTLRVRCSKGTYIRTLCHDIGAALGVGGIMESLRRTEAAGFTLAQAHPLDEVLRLGDEGRAQELLLPVERYFDEYPVLTISGRAEQLARNGNDFRCEAADGRWRVRSEEGEFLLLGECADGRMHTIKSFFEV